MHLEEQYTRQPSWKFNDFLFSNRTFSEELQSKIQDSFRTNITDDVLQHHVWHAMKPTIQRFVISKSSFLKKQKHDKYNELMLEIVQLEQAHKRFGGQWVCKALLASHCELEHIETTDIQKELLLLKKKTWSQSPNALKLLKYHLAKKKKSSLISKLQDPQKFSTQPQRPLQRFLGISMLNYMDPQIWIKQWFLNSLIFFNSLRYLPITVRQWDTFLPHRSLQSWSRTWKVINLHNNIHLNFIRYILILMGSLVSTSNNILINGHLPLSWLQAVACNFYGRHQSHFAFLL